MAMFALVVGALSMSVVLTTPSAATPSTQPTVPVMIVLDASGSMNQSDAPGPRIDAAKSAVIQLIDHLPVQTKVGLQVYGTGTGSTAGEKAAGCTDIKTLVPVTTLDAALLKSQIAIVRASGYTPIGSALRSAAAALPAEGPRSIVLESDGEDTCAPPAPCEVAKELKQQGVDLIVHTVGFKVDPTARQQLSCIAQATGGTYSDASNASQLSTALAAKVDYAITGYTPQGRPVAGAAQPSESAPLLLPGQYVDTFATAGSDQSGADGTVKYYTIPVKAGVKPYISVAMIPPTESEKVASSTYPTFGTAIDLLAKDLRSCINSAPRSINVSTLGLTPAITNLDGPVVGKYGWAEACPQSGVAILKVTRIGGAYPGKSLPVEIVVRMEPSADASKVPPAAKDSPVLVAPIPGLATAINGGTSFNDAAQLTSGATYSDSVATGENRFYSIPLHWGQRFSYLITQVGAGSPPIQYGSIAQVKVFNPVRAAVGMTRFDFAGQSWFGERTVDPFTASTKFPARYTNRDGTGGSGATNYQLDGDYYLMLTADLHPQQASSQRYQIMVVISGKVEPGPSYGPLPLMSGSTGSPTAASTPTSTGISSSTPTSASVASTGPSSSQVPASTGAATSTDPSVSRSSTTGLGSIGASSASTIAVAAAGDTTSTGSRMWVIVAAAVVLVAGAVTTGLLLRRRRQPFNPTQR